MCLFCRAPHASGTTVHADAACSVCGSPLRRAVPKAVSSDGKRTINRDISPNGISFVTHQELMAQAVLKIDSEIFRAVVQIANVRAIDGDGRDTWLVGAGFLSVMFPRSRGAFLSTEA